MMLQKIEFVGVMMIDLSGYLTPAEARRLGRQALDEAAQDKDYGLHFRRLLKIKIVEES